jgi:hypothetical protein
MGTSDDDLKAFSLDYRTARERFREAAEGAGWELEEFPVDAPDAADLGLTVDVARTPWPDDGRVLLVTSGLHGVEGFFGSAVQLNLFRHWGLRRTRSPVRRVFAHALNPYGFARVRRQNEDNVDPNRNFLLPGESYRGSPKIYAALNSLLNPERPPSALEPFMLKAMLARARFGTAAMKQAIAEGQFDYPRGLFFGGARPSRTNQIVDENIGRWLEGSHEVVHFDFHTGLGPSATCKILIDYPLTERQKSRLTDWFGPDSFEICDPSLISYHVRGGFDRWCMARLPGCDYLHLCAEFGTYAPLQVIAGLRAENQAHHWGRPTDGARHRIKERLKELFCPASTEWRSRALATGTGLVETALDRLGKASPAS